MGFRYPHRVRCALPVLLLLLCGAAGSSGGQWKPDCTKVSSGCSSCKYVKNRFQSSTRGLLQDSAQVSAAGAVGTGLQLQSTTAEAAVPQAASTSSRGGPGDGSSSSSSSAAGVPDSTSGVVTAQHYKSYGSRGDSRSRSGSRGSSRSSSSRSRSSSSSSGGSSGGGWSWGGSGVWWTPGAVLTCTACDSSRSFELVTSPNGTTHCGCKARSGVVPRGNKRPDSTAAASAWANTYVRSFTCEACSSNAVPFLPRSNLLVAWNGATWSIKCASSTKKKQSALNLPMSTLPSSSNPGPASAGSTSSSSNVVLEAAADTVVAQTALDPSSPSGAQPDTTLTAAAMTASSTLAVAPAADGQPGASAASATGAVEAMHARNRYQDASWYRRGRRKKHSSWSSGSSSSGGSGSGGSSGSHHVAPWWPGQCIDCKVVGAAADPTGTYCMCGAPPPPPSPKHSPQPPAPSPAPKPSPKPPGPSPAPRPSPSPPPRPSPSPGGACVQCVTADILTEIGDGCDKDADGWVYLTDWCPWTDVNIDTVTFTTSPNVLDPDPDAGLGAMQCSALKDQIGNTVSVTATAAGSGLTCSPSSSQYQFVVPPFGSTPAPSPSPKVPSPSPKPPGPSPAPSNACLSCDLRYYVEFLCGVDPTRLISVTDLCKVPSYALTVTYNADPATILDASANLRCSALHAIPNQQVQIAWVVNNQVACTPTSGLFSFTVPSFLPPSPSPSPSPGTGACVQCSFSQIIDDIKKECGADPDFGFFYFSAEPANTVGDHCWWTDPFVSVPFFKTTPDVLFDPGSDIGDCAKAAAHKGGTITVEISVNAEIDTGITCSPTTSNYTFLMPSF